MRCLFYFGLAFCFAATITGKIEERGLTVSCLKCHGIADAAASFCLHDACIEDYATCERICENNRLKWRRTCDTKCPPLYQRLCQKIKACKEGVTEALRACLKLCEEDGGKYCPWFCAVTSYVKNNKCDQSCLDYTCFDKASTEKHCQSS